MKERESKYADRLRELGFKPFTEILSPEDIKDSDAQVEYALGAPIITKMTRAERRRLVAQGILPAYHYMGDGTYATDENGNDWWAETRVDLKPLGFKDNFEEVRKEMGLKKPSLH